MDEYWMAFKQAVIETVKETMGCRRGTQKERWIRDPTWSMIDERKIAKCRCEQAKADPDKETTAERYRQLDRAVKRSCKSDKKTWLECKGAKAHEAASKNDNKMLYRIVRELTGAWSNSSAPIKNKDGVFLLTREEQDACWVEHFKETLNQPTPANTYDFGATPPPPDLVVNLDLITIEETKVAIPSTQSQQMLFKKCWQDQSVPSDWRKGVIVKLPKKGNTDDCNNWRGITLLLVPGKVFCSILLRSLQHAVDEILREEQAGFRAGRSCSEQIYTLRNFIEQCIEFIDFKKAFDSVHRGSLWKILRAYSIPQWFVNVFQNLYISSSCCVRTDDGYRLLQHRNQSQARMYPVTNSLFAHSRLRHEKGDDESSDWNPLDKWISSH
ncbi:hypothetical protein P4O66_003597 [Electrophorus voltai]|uniref:Reverse transcriptase domain-containing protein n=1 Tax=Electrophorus voltai TaxID=2609070 RepID=A0AAD8ZTW2_9TELE|nr:hypothetical protein P4O66_003597 [Electrophorus voltai]